MKQLLELLFQFAKIGLFTFGGGYAMLPLIEHTCVEQKKWLTQEEMLSMSALAESTPGPVAINCATFVGNKQKGIAGAIAATFGMVLPSFTIIFIISLFFDRFLELQWVKSAFAGIKIAVGILIADAAIKLFKKLPKKAFPMTIAALAFAAMLLIDIFSLHISSVVLILAAAVIGVAVYLITRGKGGAK
ncbi:MAG: chromate transporter [Clostridia bacterium]|nr:chromate transporter [Clostridia bacterium]